MPMIDGNWYSNIIPQKKFVLAVTCHYIEDTLWTKVFSDGNYSGILEFLHKQFPGGKVLAQNLEDDQDMFELKEFHGPLMENEQIVLTVEMQKWSWDYYIFIKRVEIDSMELEEE